MFNSCEKAQELIIAQFEAMKKITLYAYLNRNIRVKEKRFLCALYDKAFSSFSSRRFSLGLFSLIRCTVWLAIHYLHRFVDYWPGMRTWSWCANSKQDPRCHFKKDLPCQFASFEMLFGNWRRCLFTSKNPSMVLGLNSPSGFQSEFIDRFQNGSKLKCESSTKCCLIWKFWLKFELNTKQNFQKMSMNKFFSNVILF